MKRYIIKIFTVVAVLIALSSCDSMLEPEVYSQLTNKNFPKTEEDMTSILTSMYGPFSHDWGTNDPINGTFTWGIYSSMGSWFHLSRATTDELYDTWFPAYRFQWGSAYDTRSNLYNDVREVARATGFIDVLAKSGASDQLKKSAIAETKCLRAWMMFLLYDFYGPVSVRLDPTRLADTTIAARPTKDEYFNAMVNDLNDAIPDLPGKTNGTEKWGKVNKGLASMLLMKIYMNDHQYEKAKPIAESILNMGYSLLPNYKDVFTNEGNDEVIWEVPSGLNVPNSFLPTNIPGDCKTVCGINVDQGWAGYYMPWNFYNKFSTGDTRLQTIGTEYDATNGEHYAHGTDHEGIYLPNGAIVVKYLLPYDITKSGNFATVAFRYSDVLLSLAEIENELNGPTSKAISYLKQVTDRANTTIPESATVSKQAFKDFLLDERGRELFWEGWRREDLIRFGKFIEYGQAAGNPAKDYMVRFPIPPSVINESRGVIINNPGY